MKISKLLLIVLTCFISTFALAVPSVNQVEASISKGDYATAKKQLEEVLAKQPDSLVANKYMMEIIKLEYAKTQTPSVEYKLYENRLVTINDAIVKEKNRLAKIEQAKKDKLREERNAQTLNQILKGLLFAVILAALLFAARTVIVRRAEANRLREETQAIDNWVSDSRAALLDMNKFITATQEENPEWVTRYPLLKNILEDTLSYLEDLRNDCYNGEDIDRHFVNAENYFKEKGLI